MTVVVDASAALAWVLPSQATPSGWRFLDQQVVGSMIAPPIFEWEVRNALLTLVRRGVLPDQEYDRALTAYDALMIELGEFPADLAGLGMLARQSGLSLFDASYLVLALDRGGGIASRDAALLRVAEGSGVECFDLRGVT